MSFKNTVLNVSIPLLKSHYEPLPLSKLIHTALFNKLFQQSHPLGLYTQTTDLKQNSSRAGTAERVIAEAFVDQIINELKVPSKKLITPT